MRRRISVVVGLVALFAGVIGLGTLGACPQPHPQADACKQAIACYFTAEHNLGAVIPGLGDTQFFVDTYGDKGSCWNGDVALAHACEDRCRGLLTQDCVSSYNGAGQEPFCAKEIACAFPEECEDKGTSRSTCPTSTDPLLDKNGDPVHFPDGGPQEFAQLECTAPKPVGAPTFGCCVSPGVTVDGGACAYEYPDPGDCRAPAGNVAGTCKSKP